MSGQQSRRIAISAGRSAGASEAGRRLGFVGLLIWIGLPVVGSYVTFVPTSGWSSVSWVPVTLLGPISGTWIGYRLQKNAQRVGKILTPFFRVSVCYVLVPLFFGWIAWCNVRFLLPAVFTHLVGAKHHEVATLQKGFAGTSRLLVGCRHEIEGALFEDSSKGNYCAWQSEWDALPAEGEMTIWSTSSWFGRRYEFMTPRDVARHSAG